MNDPRYVVLVSIDEPKALKETYGFATAGWNAAPTVAAVISRLVSLYGIAPVADPNPAKKPIAGANGTAGGRNLASN